MTTPQNPMPTEPGNLFLGDIPPPSSESGEYASRYRDGNGDLDPGKIGGYEPSRQHRFDLDELDGGKRLYPHQLIPHADHPIVQEAMARLAAMDEQLPARALEQDALGYFNGFTAWLEHYCVNTVLQDVAHGKDGLSLPARLRRDAFATYCEEANHACVASDLTDQIERKTGIKLPSAPLALPRRLRRLRELVPPEHRRLVLYLFTIGTETAITGVLSKLPRYDDVAITVRAIVREHAVDEAKHNVLFSALFDHLYPQLDGQTRSLIGPLLPAVIKAFLEPDRRALRSRLTVLGLTRAAAEEVVADVYAESKVIAGIAASAAGPLALFRRHGVLDDSQTRDAFIRSGLING
jgi:P-aminobenzoate N-oxygenase AurF